MVLLHFKAKCAIAADIELQAHPSSVTWWKSQGRLHKHQRPLAILACGAERSASEHTVDAVPIEKLHLGVKAM